MLTDLSNKHLYLLSHVSCPGKLFLSSLPMAILSNKPRNHLLFRIIQITYPWLSSCVLVSQLSTVIMSEIMKLKDLRFVWAHSFGDTNNGHYCELVMMQGIMVMKCARTKPLTL